MSKYLIHSVLCIYINNNFNIYNILRKKYIYLKATIALHTGRENQELREACTRDFSI